MGITNLPYGRLPSNISFTGVYVKDYLVTHNTFKGKTILHTNAISLVVKGLKTMQFADKTIQAADHEMHLFAAGNCVTSIDLHNEAEFKSILIFFDDKALADFFINNQQQINEGKDRYPKKSLSYVSIIKDDFYRELHSITSINP